MRSLNKTMTRIALAISALFCLYFLYTSGFGVFSTESHRGLYLLFTFALCILYYPASKKAPHSKILYIFDAVLLVMGAGAILYWVVQYADYAANRVGLPNEVDLFWGAVMILVSLEVTRRVLGNVLVVLGALFVVQLYLGPYLVSFLSHKGLTVARIIEYNYLTMEGVFGTVVGVFATYVVPFLIFGAMLEKSGGGDFFIDLAKSIAGHIPGGPALIAVLSSAVFGSISGSPIANVVSTGSFTIPMMKKVGYKPEFAGAVEAAASTGGQFLPPIMGAGAFILASLTQTSYGKVCLMALVPALLYYWSLTLMVYFRARKRELVGLQREDMPKFTEVIRKGWYYVLVLVVAVVVIVLGYAPEAVAFWATIFVVICSMFRKETRFTLKKFAEGFDAAAKSSLTVGSTAATLGLIMGGITLAGMGVKFSKMLIMLSGGNLLLDIFMILLIALVIGMGLPTTASYIVMAILAAPSLIILGVPAIQAHLLVFWLAMTSNVTPPVCVTAFAAASVAEADPMKTGFFACGLAALLYIMPFTFVYRPELMLIGEPLSVAYNVFLYVVAVVALAGAIQGWLLARLSTAERILYSVSAVLMMWPSAIADTVGFIAFLALLTRQRFRTKKAAKVIEA
jgi:TRAP transporter 4TM/12TM fusion protein